MSNDPMRLRKHADVLRQFLQGDRQRPTVECDRLTMVPGENEDGGRQCQQSPE